MLKKYRLQEILNDFLNRQILPFRLEWQRYVNNKIEHQSPVQKLKTEIIASICVRPNNLVNEQCPYCNITYTTESLSHIFKTCCITADGRDIFYLDISTLIGIELVKALSDKSFYTVQLTGDMNNERQYNENIKYQFLRFSYDYIDCMLHI